MFYSFSLTPEQFIEKLAKINSLFKNQNVFISIETTVKTGLESIWNTCVLFFFTRLASCWNAKRNSPQYKWGIFYRIKTIRDLKVNVERVL